MAKVGRPSSFRPEFVEQARKLVALGATDETLADFFNVSTTTIDNWKNQHQEFLGALKESKEQLDSKVVRSLYERAMGYSHPAVKIMQNGGEVLKVPYTEHYAPDTTAAIFWLKNRQPKEWRDAQQRELTGANGGPIVVSNEKDKDALEKL